MATITTYRPIPHTMTAYAQWSLKPAVSNLAVNLIFVLAITITEICSGVLTLPINLTFCVNLSEGHIRVHIQVTKVSTMKEHPGTGGSGSGLHWLIAFVRTFYFHLTDWLLNNKVRKASRHFNLKLDNWGHVSVGRQASAAHSFQNKSPHLNMTANWSISWQTVQL